MEATTYLDQLVGAIWHIEKPLTPWLGGIARAVAAGRDVWAAAAAIETEHGQRTSAAVLADGALPDLHAEVGRHAIAGLDGRGHQTPDDTGPVGPPLQWTPGHPLVFAMHGGGCRLAVAALSRDGICPPATVIQTLDACRTHARRALRVRTRLGLREPMPSSLTTREQQVVAAYARGQHAKEIAATLGIAYSTVRVLLARAHKKLGGALTSLPADPPSE